jgi:uncharacterized membrane protein (DUF106 family)
VIDVVTALNRIANALGQYVLAPVAVLPGWLSATLIAIVTGALMLLAFKHTSNQSAIQRTRNGIKANLLALSLFKDDIRVCLRAQGELVLGAFRLLLLAIVPMLVMLVPMTLVLGQLSLWYQARPLKVGEEAVVTLRLRDDPQSAWPDAILHTSPDIEVVLGPVRVESQRAVCWNLRARNPGDHTLTFNVAGQSVQKSLAAGNGFMRVSPLRPSANWVAAVEYPGESPFAPDSMVQEISIDYPARPGWTCGSNSWLVYWFAASMMAAVVLRPVLKVNL